VKKLNSLTNAVTDLDGTPLGNQVGVKPDGTPIIIEETIGKHQVPEHEDECNG